MQATCSPLPSRPLAAAVTAACCRTRSASHSCPCRPRLPTPCRAWETTTAATMATPALQLPPHHQLLMQQRQEEQRPRLAGAGRPALRAPLPGGPLWLRAVCSCWRPRAACSRRGGSCGFGAGGRTGGTAPTATTCRRSWRRTPSSCIRVAASSVEGSRREPRRHKATRGAQGVSA